MVNFYSVGKAIGAALVLQLVDSGELSLDTHVADFWPEFAAGGKEAVTVRQALSHQAAVPAIRQLLTDDDLFAATARRLGGELPQADQRHEDDQRQQPGAQPERVLERRHGQVRLIAKLSI